LDTPKLRAPHVQDIGTYNRLSYLLDDFRMHGVSATMRRFGGILAAFIGPSGNVLETMCLKCSPVPDSSLLQTLTTIPTLRHLRLVDSFVGELFMVGLARNIQDTC
jgi:hypothetical protein